MLTDYVKQYIEKYNNMLDENLQEFIDNFFKFWYTPEDALSFFEVLNEIDMYTDKTKAKKIGQISVTEGSFNPNEIITNIVPHTYTFIYSNEY